MPGSAVSNNEVVGLELEKVQKGVEMLFERDDMFYSSIQKRPAQKVSARQMRVPLNMAPGGKFSYFNPNGGDLGRGGGTRWDKAVVDCVFMVEAIEYTKIAEWGTDSSEKAVQNSVRELVGTTLDEMRRQLDSQCMQAGNGVIGVVTTDTPASGENVIVCTTDGFGVRLMREQQTIQIFDTNLTTLRGSGVISFYDIENNTIHVSPQIANVGVGDKIVVDGIADPTATPALLGVPYHDNADSTGTWLGFTRSSTPQIRASRVNANSAALTLPLPRLAINKIGNRVGIKNNFSPDAWMHPCQQQAYEEIGQLVSIIQKQASEEKLNMYFGGNMQMAGAPVKTSFSWDKTRIDFITQSVWGRSEILPIGFYTTDGRKIYELRGPSGGIMTADIFYMVVGMQTYVNNPAACSYIDSLAVPSGY